jgi:hypothetical protein
MTDHRLLVFLEELQRHRSTSPPFSPSRERDEEPLASQRDTLIEAMPPMPFDVGLAGAARGAPDRCACR